MGSSCTLKEAAALPFSLISVESPQALLENAALWIQKREEGLDFEEIFYYCSYERLQVFGMSLWAHAYEECQDLWKNRVRTDPEDFSFFPFMVDVKTASGFIFLGIRLGLKYFLLKDADLFTKLQSLIRSHGGLLFEGRKIRDQT